MATHCFCGASLAICNYECVMAEDARSAFEQLNRELPYIRPSKANRLIHRLHERIAGSSVRISHRGVPHLVFKRYGVEYSICYFASTKSYKGFWPYGSPTQQHIHLKTYHDIFLWLDILSHE